MYKYHIQGLDNLVSNKDFGKQTIEDTVLSMETLFNKTIGNYLIRLFFDAKSDEIVSLYSEGPRTRNSSRLTTTLRRINPTNNSKWRNIEQ